MKDLSNVNQADIIKAFNSTPRYLDNLLNTCCIYIALLLTALFPPKFMINVITLTLKTQLIKFA